jgi:SHS2 domain-containing protein
MPYEEIQHTADWSLRVWAADLPSLFVEAALGMNALSGLKLASGPVKDKTFESTAPDSETLLVNFLSELVFAVEQESTGFNHFKVKLTDQRIKVQMEGAPVESINKTIKAVTYHNLQIRHTAKGYETEIVFDV